MMTRASLPELSEVDILSARLRTELDAALGRDTPRIIREAADRYDELEEPELADRVDAEREREPGAPEPGRVEPEVIADRDHARLEREIESEPEPDYFERDPFDTTRRIDPERYYAEPDGPDRDIGDREPGD